VPLGRSSVMIPCASILFRSKSAEMKSFRCRASFRSRKSRSTSMSMMPNSV